MRKKIVSILVGLFLALSVQNVNAETIKENWDNLKSWDLDNVSSASVRDHKLSTNGNGYVLRHKTIVFNQKYPMSLEGSITSPDVKSKNKPSYFGFVLQSVVDGNFYGSVAAGNWVDEFNGIYGPYWIIFDNEWDGKLWTPDSKWWSPEDFRLPYPEDGKHNFKLEWKPTNSNGTLGKWSTTYIHGKYKKLVTRVSPELPLPLGGVAPRLGFGRGRAIVGPLEMQGTKY